MFQTFERCSLWTPATFSLKTWNSLRVSLAIFLSTFPMKCFNKITSSKSKESVPDRNVWNYLKSATKNCFYSLRNSGIHEGFQNRAKLSIWLLSHLKTDLTSPVLANSTAWLANKTLVGITSVQGRIISLNGIRGNLFLQRRSKSNSWEQISQKYPV